MKVILTAEVKGKGHEGDVVEVARGYAVNYLLPRKMAVAATPGNITQLGARMSNIQKRNDARRAEAEGVAASLNGKTVVIEAKAGDEGKLFGSVTTLMIEEAVAAQLGQDVDHRRIDLAGSIKTIGDHPVVTSVFGEVKAEFVVRVVREGAPAEAASAPAAQPTTQEAGEGTEASASPSDMTVLQAEEAAESVAEPEAIAGTEDAETEGDQGSTEG